jgi:GNAT superfamily N-acetyltransferase
MTMDAIIFREATRSDMPGIAHVRISVVENAATAADLEQRGITNESVAASFEGDSKGWVAETGAGIVAFSIADRQSRSIFALFVMPDYEGRGLGSRLLELALRWLGDNGVDSVWLTTDPDTRAAGFYSYKGWVQMGITSNGELRFEKRLDL